MAEQTAPAGLDHKTIADGIGELREGKGYARVVVEGKTVAYLKRASVTVPAALVAHAPKKLGTFAVEKNGQWAGVAAPDDKAARAVLEYVMSKRTPAQA